MLLHRPKPEHNAEDGYVLLTVLVMIFLVLLMLSIAAPRVAKQIQRDKEEEAIQRGLQYKRAIRLYYRKFGAYPSDIKQLENSNQMRFLRKRYKDPITGKDDWRLIHMGEAKVPPTGFFGQPLQAGLSSASTGAGMTGSTPGLYAAGTPGTGDGSGTGTGASGTTGTGATGTGASSTGASGNTSSGSSGSSSFGFNNNSSGTSGSSSGFGFSNSGGVGSTPSGTNGPGASSMSGGSTFGGGPIVGVGIPVKKNSLIAYRKQTKYSDWEFVYDPQEELLFQGGGITNGGNVNGAGSGGNSAGIGTSGSNGTTSGSGTNSSGSGFGFGNSGSNSGSGSGFGFGNSGSGSTNPPNSQ